MNALHFDEPVYLTIGIGIPVEVGTVEHAYALLNDWPVWRRNSAHAVALNACKAALAGEIDVETAKATLAAFARRYNPAADGADVATMKSYPSIPRPAAGAVELHS